MNEAIPTVTVGQEIQHDANSAHFIDLHETARIYYIKGNIFFIFIFFTFPIFDLRASCSKIQRGTLENKYFAHP